jgi:hypothetical protein
VKAAVRYTSIALVILSLIIIEEVVVRPWRGKAKVEATSQSTSTGLLEKDSSEKGRTKSDYRNHLPSNNDAIANLLTDLDADRVEELRKYCGSDPLALRRAADMLCLMADRYALLSIAEANDFVRYLEVQSLDPLSSIVLRVAALKAMQIIVQSLADDGSHETRSRIHVAVMRIAEDELHGPELRSVAIRLIGRLHIRQGQGLIRRILLQGAKLGSDQVVSSACLAQAKMGGDYAIDLVGNVLKKTGSKSVYAAAVLSMSKVKSWLAVKSIIDSASRFPDHYIVPAVFIDMEDMVISELCKIDSEYMMLAIRSTDFLTGNDQRSRWRVCLQRLLDHLDGDELDECARRLLFEAKRLDGAIRRGLLLHLSRSRVLEKLRQSLRVSIHREMSR